MKVGSVEYCFITVGLESSISEAFKIGFMEKREWEYSKPYSFFKYFFAKLDINGQALSGLAGQSLQFPNCFGEHFSSLRF